MVAIPVRQLTNGNGRQFESPPRHRVHMIGVIIFGPAPWGTYNDVIRQKLNFELIVDICLLQHTMVRWQKNAIFDKLHRSTVSLLIGFTIVSTTYIVYRGAAWLMCKNISQASYKLYRFLQRYFSVDFTDDLIVIPIAL